VISGRGWLVVRFALETLLSRPPLDQGAVDGEILVREQAVVPRLTEHGVEKDPGHITSQQPFPVLGKVSTADRKYISAPKYKYISWKGAMG
jgi:hypothetical protein